jgi:hypothetical protein
VHSLYKIHSPCNCNRENTLIATGRNPVATQTDSVATGCELVATWTDPVTTGSEPVSTQTNPIATGHNLVAARTMMIATARVGAFSMQNTPRCIITKLYIYLYDEFFIHSHVATVNRSTS